MSGVQIRRLLELRRGLRRTYPYRHKDCPGYCACVASLGSIARTFCNSPATWPGPPSACRDWFRRSPPWPTCQPIGLKTIGTFLSLARGRAFSKVSGRFRIVLLRYRDRVPGRTSASNSRFAFALPLAFGTRDWPPAPFLASSDHLPHVKVDFRGVADPHVLRNGIPRACRQAS